MRLGRAVAACLAAASFLRSAAAAQQPPADTLALPDTVAVLAPDSLPGPLAADSVPDSLAVSVVPELDGRAPVGFATAVWLFEREDLIAMRGLSLADLLAQVPGAVRLRGGDYGAPQALTAYGLGGGGVRVYWDGFERVPLDGSVADLSRIGLGGVERVRVERHPGELRIELTSLRDGEEPRPTSLVEAGTGDLDTNFFRATFLHPRALGGSLALAFDRVDTDGPNQEEATRTGAWLRYRRHWGEDFAVTAEWRRKRSGAAIDGYPGEGSRVDWVVRARWRPAPQLVVQGFSGASSLEGLAREERLPVDRSRRQHGLAADLAHGPVRASAGLRLFGGGDLPSVSGDLSVSAELPRWGGVNAETSRERWDGEGVGLSRLRAWTRPVLGLSAFGNWEEGTKGAPLYPLPPESPDPAAPPDVEPPPSPAALRFHERRATRWGARFQWAGVELAAARVSLETDSLPVLGLPMDREGAVLDGIERTGLELFARTRVPFVSDGFALTGALTLWDEPARYLPRRSYQAAITFHDVFYPSGNLEIWATIGAEGRDPMPVPVEEPGAAGSLATAPFYQSWFAFIQVRVQTFRLFVAWDNFTIRRNNRDFPGRGLPLTRSIYGIRWTLFD
ncbi:MAG: TonB-dependent receptor plug domain-containing protein [Gemmatimonadota bacterium]|nr:TonB-dependent receptor plug domain-containing protein [Gemmatimonadota bacterium]